MVRQHCQSNVVYEFGLRVTLSSCHGYMVDSIGTRHENSALRPRFSIMGLMLRSMSDIMPPEMMYITGSTAQLYRGDIYPIKGTPLDPDTRVSSYWHPRFASWLEIQATVRSLLDVLMHNGRQLMITWRFFESYTCT